MNASDTLLAAVSTLLRPLVRVLLARGVAFHSFAELARRAYVEVAETDFAIEGKPQTASRVSVLTGLSRKDVARIKASAYQAMGPEQRRMNRAARVVSAWTRHFSRPSGRRRIAQNLPFEGGAESFSALVKRYSGDMPARTVLDELIRVGAAVEEEDGKLRLVQQSYLPVKDEAQKLLMLGTDVADLISVIGHNLDAAPDQALFQRKTTYNNLSQEFLPNLRGRLAQEAQSLLEKYDRSLAQHDRDENPRAAGTGRKRVVFGIYYLESDYPEATEFSGGPEPKSKRQRNP
jgi:hypothetical protein